MQRSILRLPKALFIVAAGASILSGADGRKLLYGQNTGETTRSGPPTAVVALVDELPAQHRAYAALVLRRAGLEPRDVILLPRASASGELLDAATRRLLHVRATQGDRSDSYRGKRFQVLTIGVNKPETAAADWMERYGEQARELVRQLYDEPPRAIPGVGHVPAIEFYLPAPMAAN